MSRNGRWKLGLWRAKNIQVSQVNFGCIQTLFFIAIPTYFKIFCFHYRLSEQNDDTVYVMRGCVPVPKSVLHRGVCYKYYVYPDNTSTESMEEDFKTDSYHYRFLQLSNCGGKPIFGHQNSIILCVCMIVAFTAKFDIQVFPESGRWEKFKNRFGASHEVHTSSSILALKTMLPMYFTDVCNAYPEWDIVGRARQLEWFFSSLSFPSMYSSKTRRVFPLQFNLKKVKAHYFVVFFHISHIIVFE